MVNGPFPRWLEGRLDSLLSRRFSPLFIGCLLACWSVARLILPKLGQPSFAMPSIFKITVGGLIFALSWAAPIWIGQRSWARLRRNATALMGAEGATAHIVHEVGLTGGGLSMWIAMSLFAGCWELLKSGFEEAGPLPASFLVVIESFAYGVVTGAVICLPMMLWCGYAWGRAMDQVQPK